MKNNKIGIIGHFGGGSICLDGQTVKTKILFDELSSMHEFNIIKVDTYYKKTRPLKLLIDTLNCLIKVNKVIVLLSGNGMKLYFPLLYIWSRFFNLKVYHDVIGGNLDSYVKRFWGFKHILNTFLGNWVETNNLKKKLEDLGVNNCLVIPNFKRLDIVKLEIKKYDEPFKFCIFSRIMKEKGVEKAINAIDSINKNLNREICKLDIYGPIDENYKDAFRDIMRNASKAIKYCSTVAYDKSTDTLSNYYALLFPTFWDGEGFPGTIIDAFASGIPVVASDWNCNKEIVKNELNGIVYPNNNMKDLKSAILWLITNKDKMPIFKANCIKSAKLYQPEAHIRKIMDMLH